MCLAKLSVFCRDIMTGVEEATPRTSDNGKDVSEHLPVRFMSADIEHTERMERDAITAFEVLEHAPDVVVVELNAMTI